MRRSWSPIKRPRWLLSVALARLANRGLELLGDPTVLPEERGDVTQRLAGGDVLSLRAYRPENHFVSSPLDKNLVSRHPELLGQPHRLAAAVHEELGFLHRNAR